MLFRWLSHEMGSRPRIRIWTPQMEAYGQFDIISWADFEALREMGKRYNWTFDEAH